jgi:hypothetical protein
MRQAAAVSDDVRTLEKLATPDGPNLGRNEPCWCGSGRKFNRDRSLERNRRGAAPPPTARTARLAEHIMGAVSLPWLRELLR